MVSAALASLEQSDIPDVGVEPLADLMTWFTTSVAQPVSSVALTPDGNSGVLSFLALHFLSSFRFQRHGLTPGSDVLSVLSRGEYHVNEQDLDSAARELNQLTGPAKELLHDWLDGARRKLEAQQALEVSLLDSISQWMSLTVLRTCKRERRRLDSWMVPIHRCNLDDLPMYFIAPCYFRSSQTLLYHQDRQPRVTCTLRLTVHQSQDVDMTLRASMRQVIQETITVTLSHPFEGCLRTELSCGYNRLQNSLCTISFCPIRMQPEGCQLLPPVKSPLLTLTLGGRLSPRVKNSTAKLSWGKGILDFTQG